MSKWKNTKTGRVVDVPDDPATRADRPGRAKQWAQLLTQMSRSKRWARVTDEPTRPVEPSAEPPADSGKGKGGKGKS